jgi:zinc transporter ZupT
VTVFIYLLALTVVAVIGAIVGITLGSIAPRRLEFIVHIATGALLGITLLDILPEAKQSLSWTPFVLAAGGGYLLLWLVGKFVFHVCPSCALAHVDGNAILRNRRNLLMLAVALGIHCSLDGVAIAVGGQPAAHPNLGLLLGIGLHKLPEGLALGLLLVGAGYDRRRAVAWAAGIESLTSVGGLFGMLFLRGAGASAIGITFAVVGGGFLYLVFNAVEGALGHRKSLSLLTTFATETIGFAGTGALIWMISSLGR